MKALIFYLGLLTLCSCLQSNSLEPVDPLWERESCSRCRMTLSDKRYAVQRILSSGQVHFYDDLNCALNHNHTDSEGVLYVRPFGADKWVLAKDAKYQSGLMTPMGSGYGAVLDGGTINFQEVVDKLKE